MRSFGLAFAVLMLSSTGVRAEVAPSGDALWKVRAEGRLMVDGGLVLALPVTWRTGLSTGVGGGFTSGRTFAWGVRGSWSTATESSLAWTVSHSDFRVMATGTVQHAAGRGIFALRLGLGPTLVRESRVRNQGMRAGLTGSELETSSLATIPVAALDGIVAVHVAGNWLLVVSGGPSILVSDGSVHAGWATQLGVGWQL